MKKGIFIAILIGMFGFAIYSFVLPSDEAAEPENEQTEEDVEATAEASIGLEQGNIAPDFELPLLDGGTAKLSDYRGQRVMLNFWATWCGPCRSEMPDMQKLYENKDIVILAVNLADTESSEKNAPNFVEEYELTFPILLDEKTEVADLYQIQPIPTSFMIDSNGIIQNKALGALNYELMVQEFEKMD